ncbi:MAG TPA: 16S rRNA (uracil(1498)-N(3))-methyltransferase [Acidimicrobiia bacterium]|nr:16S rRNA (uracil(1498)-N(3))-methyltransferase [Acidimicrobiia bacterium]
MTHIPHLVVPAPWEESRLGLSIMQWRHVTKVLRMKNGEQVTYTDGLGTIGEGELGHQSVERGEERAVDRPSQLTVAVAPPSNKDRQRFLVEKLAELGVARLVWIETRHGKNRVANPSKVFGWVLSAVEQSKGAYLMETSDDLVALDELEGDLVFCHPGGTERPGPASTVVIGPEGGFADDEIPAGSRLWDLGPTTLRVETAAIAAAISVRA